MPELPEVETVCRGLQQNICGLEITNLILNRNNLRYKFQENMADMVINARITSITRRAKYILMQLDNDKTIISHLGMSGRYVLHNVRRNIYEKHDHVIFYLGDRISLVYNDPRRFGMIDVASKADLDGHYLLKNMGIEPLSDAFDADYLAEQLKTKNQAIKKVIMDASLVVGVGNIYASEALFRSNIHPERAAKSLSKAESSKLVHSIKQVLIDAINNGGSSLKDYVKSSGEKGYFQNMFNVYGKAGKACSKCGTAITKITQSGRATYFCGGCQW